MPKTIRKSYAPRKRYTAKNTSAPTVRKPYGGRNNNDAFVRIEQCVQLVARDGQNAFMTYRSRTG